VSDIGTYYPTQI